MGVWAVRGACEELGGKEGGELGAVGFGMFERRKKDVIICIGMTCNHPDLGRCTELLEEILGQSESRCQTGSERGMAFASRQISADDCTRVAGSPRREREPIVASSRGVAMLLATLLSLCSQHTCPYQHGEQKVSRGCQLAVRCCPFARHDSSYDSAAKVRLPLISQSYCQLSGEHACDLSTIP